MAHPVSRLHTSGSCQTQFENRTASAIVLPLKKPTANPEYLDNLKQAILEQHGCEAIYVESVNVLETVEGHTVWRGIVAVFQIAGHPQAATCYAWGSWQRDGKMRYVTVLGIPPVDSPRKALQAAVVAEPSLKS
jgi:hypothetical protein